MLEGRQLIDFLHIYSRIFITITIDSRCGMIHEYNFPQYSSQVQAEVIGKPSAAFFNQAAKMIGLSPGDLVMIGDDVESDVGGAMSAGLQGILVKTGKFRYVPLNS